MHSPFACVLVCMCVPMCVCLHTGMCIPLWVCVGGGGLCLVTSFKFYQSTSVHAAIVLLGQLSLAGGDSQKWWHYFISNTAHPYPRPNSLINQHRGFGPSLSFYKYPPYFLFFSEMVQSIIGRAAAIRPISELWKLKCYCFFFFFYLLSWEITLTVVLPHIFFLKYFC